MRFAAMIAGLTVCCTASIFAHQAAAPPEATPDIVVEGRADPDEPDPTNARNSVIVGSRIPRPSTQNNPDIAMRTSANGLTPDSGLDAFKGDASLTWKSCGIKGAALGKKVACGLVGVQKLVDAGKLEQARAAATGIARLGTLSLEERYATQRYLYRIAEMTNDQRGRDAALAAMMDTGLMPANEEVVAIRSLASGALKRNDRTEALRRFEQAISLDAEDVSSRINAAALLQQDGSRDRATDYVRAAITIARRTGREVPQAWLDNAR